MPMYRELIFFVCIRVPNEQTDSKEKQEDVTPVSSSVDKPLSQKRKKVSRKLYVAAVIALSSTKARYVFVPNNMYAINKFAHDSLTIYRKITSSELCDKLFEGQRVPRTKENVQTSWNILLLASQNKLVRFPTKKNVRSAAIILRDSIQFQDAVSKARSAFQTLRKSKIPPEETDASEQTAVSFSQLDLNNVVSEKQSDEFTQGSQASEATPQSQPEPVQTFVAPKKRRRSVIEHPLRQVCLELLHARPSFNLICRHLIHSPKYTINAFLHSISRTLSKSKLHEEGSSPNQRGSDKSTRSNPCPVAALSDPVRDRAPFPQPPTLQRVAVLDLEETKAATKL